MTVAPSITRSTIPHQPQVTDQNAQDHYEVCCRERAAQVDVAVRQDIIDFTTDGETPSTPKKKPSKRERRGTRHNTSCRKARNKRRPSLAEKLPPPKDIPMEGSVNRQIWTKKKLKTSTDWNRVAFDHETFIEFNKLVAKMSTKRRAWFRRKFYYAGAVDTKAKLAAA